MLKKTIAFLGAVTLLAAAVCGCASQQGTSQAGSAGAGDDEVIKITMWYPHQWDALDSWFDQKVEEFNELHAGEIELSWESVVRSDSFGYEDKISAAITSDTLPDIIGIDGPNLSSYAANGIVVPLDDRISEEDKADFMPSSVQQCTYNGQMYGVSSAESSVAIYYNVDMLESIGKQAPTSIDEAWTWSEYYDIAKALTTDTVKGATLIMDKGEGLMYAFQPFWVSNGTDVMSEDGTQAEGYINSEAGIEAATYLQKFFLEGLSNIDPLPNEFAEGKSATWLGGCWEAANLEANYPDLNWGVTYFPRADTGTQVSPSGDWCLSITNNCENQDAAWEVISFLTNSENCKNFCDKDYYGQPPARISSLEEMEEYNEMPYALFKEQLMETGHARPRTPVYPTLTAKFAEGIINIFTGADVKETLDSIAQTVDQEYQTLYQNG